MAAGLVEGTLGSWTVITETSLLPETKPFSEWRVEFIAR
jgi:hypothetical protein